MRAIEVLCTIEPSDPIECALPGLLLAAYKHHLRGIVEAAPSWVSEEMLSPSECIGDQRTVLWMSEI